MAHDFIKVPPDSTGKNIRHTKRMDIVVTNPLVDLNLLHKGDGVVGNSSGATAFFVGYRVELGDIYIYVLPIANEFVEGEQLLINGIDTATVDHFITQHTPNSVIVDPDYSDHKLQISHEGSAYVRFQEGDLAFDAFGNAQFSEVTQIDNHIFTYGDTPERYYDKTANGGVISTPVTDSSLLLSVTDVSGSCATRTTNQYYPYNPGEGNELIMSLRLGDTGKEGVVRRWGFFDDEDGMFFELNGTQRRMGLRNSASGTVITTYVEDNEFNGDPVDDINISEFLIDPTKYNLYWIDYQWLGVGKVRMGVFAPNGKRITIHTFENPNKYTLPYTKRGTLPFKLEMFNTSSTASASELRMVCATVSRQVGNVNYPGQYITMNTAETAVSSSEFTPVMTLRPQITFNGVTNRTSILPVELEVCVDGDPVRLDMVIDADLTGSTFSEPISSISSTDIDLDAASLSNGRTVNSSLFSAGVTTKVIEETLNGTLVLNADGVTQPTFTIAARAIKTGGNANIAVKYRWKESR